LSSGTDHTLESIGRTYGVTRERIRQIVHAGIDSVKKKQRHPLLLQAEEKILRALEQKNGIMNEQDLFVVLGGDKGEEQKAVSFFVTVLGSVEKINYKGEVSCAVATRNFNLAQWRQIKGNLKQILEKRKDVCTMEELHALAQRAELKVTQAQLQNYLAVSEEIRQNSFGKWGIASWQEITPKGMREKVYLILKEQKNPLHFRDIAKRIEQYGLAKVGRRAHPQTVHNELIKDPRFVLIGRGTYALSEWGYKDGTVKDVLKDIFSEEEMPLSSEQIIAQVLKVRQVKRSTVMINLHNFFQRVDKNRYTVKRVQ